MEDQYHTCFFPVFWYLSSSWIFKNNCKWFNCKYALYFFHWMKVYLWCMSSQIVDCEHKLSKYSHILIKTTFLQSSHYFNYRMCALLIFNNHLLLLIHAIYFSLEGLFSLFFLCWIFKLLLSFTNLITYSIFLLFSTSKRLTWNNVSISNTFFFSLYNIFIMCYFVLYKRKHWV